MQKVRKQRKTRNKLTGILVMLLLLGLLSGCGKKDKEEKYTSPSFDKTSPGESTENVDLSEVEWNEASYGDAAVETAKAKITFRLPEPPNPVPEYAGYYSETAYVNPFLGLAFDAGGSEWGFYTIARLASATGQTEDEITNFREGLRTPYDYETTYYAVAYARSTASNIIISTVNPDKNTMEGLNAGKYLSAVASRNGRKVVAAHFLGKECYVLDLPEEETGVGRRVQFAYDHENLVVLITLTLQKEDKLEDVLARFTVAE